MNGRGFARAVLIVLGAVALATGSWTFVAIAGLLVLTFWHPGERGRS